MRLLLSKTFQGIVIVVNVCENYCIVQMHSVQKLFAFINMRTKWDGHWFLVRGCWFKNIWYLSWLPLEQSLRDALDVNGSSGQLRTHPSLRLGLESRLGADFGLGEVGRSFALKPLLIRPFNTPQLIVSGFRGFCILSASESALVIPMGLVRSHFNVPVLVLVRQRCLLFICQAAVQTKA